MLLSHPLMATSVLQKLPYRWYPDHNGQRKAQNSQVAFTHKAEISRKSNPRTLSLEKRSTGKLLLLSARLTTSHLLIWLTLSVTNTETPGNLIPTHGVRATCRHLTFLVFCNLIGWLFHISLSLALVIWEGEVEKTASKDTRHHKREFVEASGFQNCSKHFPYGEHGWSVAWLCNLEMAPTGALCSQSGCLAKTRRKGQCWLMPDLCLFWDNGAKFNSSQCTS